MVHYNKEVRISFSSFIICFFLLIGNHFSFLPINGELDNELSEADSELIVEYLEQARILFDQRYTDSTIFHYDKVLAIDPLNIDALNGKAIVLDFVGAHEDAISYFDKVLSIDSKNVEALLGKSFALDKLGKSEEANSYFDKVLTTVEIQQPLQDISEESLESLQDFFDQAEQFLEEENFEAAITFYDMVLEIDSSDIDALYGKAFALASIDNHEDAILFYEKALATDSSDIGSLNGIALSLDSIGDHEKAISFYDMVLEIDSSDIDALYGKALSLESLGRVEESLSNLEKVETLLPSEVEFRTPNDIQNEDSIEKIAESDQFLFFIIGGLIIILVIIILIDFVVRRNNIKNSKPSKHL